MKNNTKLIMETWRRFINEDSPLNDESRLTMTDPEDKEPEGEQLAGHDDPEFTDTELDPIDPILDTELPDDSVEDPGYHFEDDFEEEI